MTHPLSGNYSGWSLYWLVWFTGSFALFLGPEIYALCTDWQRTLSAAVWRLEAFRQGEPIPQWSAGHLLFIGAFALTFAWLTMHFGFGWWR
jgi:hypothetical protein